MIVALGLSVAAAPTARAGNRIALVACDLFAPDGPTAIFRQISGSSQNKQSGITFRSSSIRSETDDVTGQSCAKVLANLAKNGFQFLDSSISGARQGELVSIWQD
jgi:hypothetical protein